MPPRLVCVAILLYWSLAAFGLITRDFLPELSLGHPPDLRTISRAEEGAPPSRWSVEVIDDPAAPEARRAVGQAVAESHRRRDGWIVLKTDLWFDSEGLLKGTAFANKSDLRIEVRSTYQVDPSGNLRAFRAGVKAFDDPEEFVVVDGRLKGRALEVVVKGPLPALNQKRTIPYEPRSVVQNALGPIDRLPGLHVGQRWDTRVVSPLTGKVDTVRVEVTGKRMIHWGNNPVSTLEVVTHMSPLTARTWVRPDGLVLRQEVPFPFVKLILERLPDPPEAAAPVPRREEPAR